MFESRSNITQAELPLVAPAHGTPSERPSTNANPISDASVPCSANRSGARGSFDTSVLNIQPQLIVESPATAHYPLNTTSGTPRSPGVTPTHAFPLPTVANLSYIASRSSLLAIPHRHTLQHSASAPESLRHCDWIPRYDTLEHTNNGPTTAVSSVLDGSLVIHAETHTLLSPLGHDRLEEGSQPGERGNRERDGSSHMGSARGLHLSLHGHSQNHNQDSLQHSDSIKSLPPARRTTDSDHFPPTIQQNIMAGSALTSAPTLPGDFYLVGQLPPGFGNGSINSSTNSTQSAEMANDGETAGTQWSPSPPINSLHRKSAKFSETKYKNLMTLAYEDLDAALPEALIVCAPDIDVARLRSRHQKIDKAAYVLRKLLVINHELLALRSEIGDLRNQVAHLQDQNQNLEQSLVRHVG